MKFSTIKYIIIGFVENAHGSQTRKYTGEPYIGHPIAVCNIVSKYTDDIPTLVAALFHDVVEDTDVTIEQIREFLNGILPPIFVEISIRIILELTDVFTKEAYPELNRKERKRRETERMSMISEEAQLVKYADIIHNAPSIIINDKDFAPVFIQECGEKLRVMDKGNPILREIAIKSLLTIEDDEYYVIRLRPGAFPIEDIEYTVKVINDMFVFYPTELEGVMMYLSVKDRSITSIRVSERKAAI
jgi:hypothetical protein